MDTEEKLPRYIAGIDLGTTNSAVAFVDMEQRKAAIQDFPVLQITAPGESETRPLLPSFHYEPGGSEFGPGTVRLPWQNINPRFITGIFARDHGAQVPGRLIASAKSWLSHSSVDRTAPILPWHAAPDVEKVSPVDVSSRYLLHIRESWNHAHPEHLLEDQEVILTVPASFDEIARELTIESAARAGLPRVILLEEPQAAFYCWISANIAGWKRKVSADQKILICDIGGGTTDLTLIEVRTGEKGLGFHRIAVGDHLILGGDNLDLALAYHIEKNKLNNRRLTPRQFGVLVRNCQYAKEMLLGEDAPERVVVNIPGTGTSLIGGGIQTELTKEEAVTVLVDGFFPVVDLTEKPLVRQSGFQEFGLPYAPDPAVTKYLAAFLTAHRAAPSGPGDHDPARPDSVLFNGGVLASATIRNRILEVLAQWFSGKGKEWEPAILENDHPELAVARGAAYFGLVRHGEGVRIESGLARSYYIGIETGEAGMKALCLAPAGLREDGVIDLSGQKFYLLIRQPVEFPLYVSSIRTTDEPGAMTEIDPLEMYALPPIRTVLKSGKKIEAGAVTVQLHTRLTEVGTLDVWCTETGGNRSWKLQFDIRSATRTDLKAHAGAGEASGVVDTETVERCREEIIRTFSPEPAGKSDPGSLVRRLETVAGIDRSEWPSLLLRSMWEVVLEQERGRNIDPVYEARWLNLLGFTLRPGYGVAVDDWRMKQTWLLFQKGVVHGRNQACRAEWWILWRRVAGGLNGGQQRALAQPLIAALRILYSGQEERRKLKGRADEIRYERHEMGEIWRLLGSLEHLGANVKKELGERALRTALKKESISDPAIWALGRIGARVPLYGPLNELVDTDTVESWIDKLIAGARPGPTLFFGLMEMCRRTDDRYRDISDDAREKAVRFMRENNAPEKWIGLILDAGKLGDEEQQIAFGEQLPKGLRLAI